MQLGERALAVVNLGERALICRASRREGNRCCASRRDAFAFVHLVERVIAVVHLERGY